MSYSLSIARLLVLALALFSSFIFLTPERAAAVATYEPTRFDDPLPDGCRPEDCSLREAIIAANGSRGNDRIELSEGVYTLSLVGRDEDVAATGDLDITATVGIGGAGPERTMIDAAQIDRVFDVIGQADSPILLELHRLTISNGHAVASAASTGNGGAIDADANGLVDLLDTIVRGNIADGSGGGIHGDGPLVYASGSTVEGNRAGLAGGGIYSSGETRLIVAHVQDNVAEEGGGIWTSSARVRIQGAVLSRNTADRGGGIFLSGSPSTGAPGQVLPAMEVGDSTISDNTARQDGGGVFSAAAFTLKDTTLSGNTAGRGGAILTLGDLDMLNATVSGNSATSTVGGVFVDRGNATLNYVTIAGNSAGIATGAGLGNDTGRVTVRNTIIAGSSGGANCGGDITSAGHNLEDRDTCGFAADGDQTNVDPLLAPLAVNGGRELTHSLRPGSPAIDAVDMSDCIDFDQRALVRHIDGDGDGIVGCDVGAYELQGPHCLSPGDANGDGHLDSRDALFIHQFLARLVNVRPCFPDINLDGYVTAVDALLILQIDAGLLPPPPPA